MIPLPPTMYLVAGAVAASLVAGAWGGYEFASGQCAKARVQAVERALEQRAEQDVLDDEIASRFEAERVRLKLVYRDLGEIIDATPGPSAYDCKFPTAWVWAWHAANVGSGDTPGKPDASLPAPAYSDQPGAEGDVPEPRLGGPGVSRSVRTPSWLERMGVRWERE